MALFAVSTGCRAREVCELRWEWEIPIPELSTSVFIIPGTHVKNTIDRLVVLNRLARAVCPGDEREATYARLLLQGPSSKE